MKTVSLFLKTKRRYPTQPPFLTVGRNVVSSQKFVSHSAKKRGAPSSVVFVPITGNDLQV